MTPVDQPGSIDMGGQPRTTDEDVRFDSLFQFLNGTCNSNHSHEAVPDRFTS